MLKHINHVIHSFTFLSLNGILCYRLHNQTSQKFYFKVVFSKIENVRNVKIHQNHDVNFSYYDFNRSFLYASHMRKLNEEKLNYIN